MGTPGCASIVQPLAISDACKGSACQMILILSKIRAPQVYLCDHQLKPVSNTAAMQKTWVYPASLDATTLGSLSDFQATGDDTAC